MLNMSVREKYPSTAFCKGLTIVDTTNLDNETPKLELDQMIIKGLIDQNYKILHRTDYIWRMYLPLTKLISPSPIRTETTQWKI